MGNREWFVTAEPVGRMWHITVSGVAGATQARAARDIDDVAADFIEESVGAKIERGDLRTEIVLPREIQKILDHAEHLRLVSDDARREANAETVRAVRALKSQGMTVREIGFALGVSFQRVQQLVKG